MSEAAAATTTAETATTTTEATATTTAATAQTTTATETSESLLPKPGGTEKTAEVKPDAKTDEMAWLPEKYRVLNDKGELDLAASSKKLGEGYGNLSKKLGTGEAPPATPADYAYTPPEQFKDVQLDDALATPFRERMHKVGLNQQQFDAVMGEYFNLVPQVLDAAAKLTATEARAELSKVWKTPTELDAGIAAASRAINGAGDVSVKLWEKFGRDPDFIRFAAGMGKEMAEDRSPNNAGGGAVENINELLAHPAYRDPKHAEHSAISEKVRKHFAAKHGNAAALQ